ncbi:RNA-directed DNA polymerase, eukaryota [Tanacetum coccineum]
MRGARMLLFHKIFSWGEVMELEDGNEYLFPRKRLCIKTKHANNILDSFKIIVKGKVFQIRAKELLFGHPDRLKSPRVKDILILTFSQIRGFKGTYKGRLLRRIIGSNGGMKFPMNCLSLNIQGLGSKAKKDWIRELTTKHKVSFLSLQETKKESFRLGMSINLKKKSYTGLGIRGRLFPCESAASLDCSMMKSSV